MTISFLGAYIEYLLNIRGVRQYTTDEPYSKFYPLYESPSDLQSRPSYPCYNTLMKISFLDADIEYKLSKLI